MILLSVEITAKNGNQSHRYDFVNSVNLASVNKIVNKYLKEGCTSIVVYEGIYSDSQEIYSVESK